MSCTATTSERHVALAITVRPRLSVGGLVRVGITALSIELSAGA